VNSSRGEAARERILAAAVRRIAEEGIDGVRIARIAMDARVSPSLIHYHFATREALLAQALDYSYAHASDTRIRSGELPGTSHAERLDAMLRQCLPFTPALEQDWVLWVELWLRAVRHPDLREVAEELYGRLHEWFADELGAGVASGEFAEVDTDAVADLALALIDGYGLRALIGDSAIPLEHAHAAISAALARQLGVGELLVPASGSTAATDATVTAQR
jgi:AcrR family transcriptional regulator